MTLASQSSRSHSASRSSRGAGTSLLSKSILLVVVGALTSLAGGYWLMKSDESISSTLANDSVSLSASRIGLTSPTLQSSDLATMPLPVVVAEPSAAQLQNGTTPPVAPPAVSPAVPPVTTPPVTTPPAATPPAAAPSSPTTPPAKTNGITSGQVPTDAPSTALDGSPTALLAQGIALAASDPVKARALLSTALLAGSLDPIDAKRASNMLSDIGRALVFTPVYNANDPLFFQYTIASGDSLERIVRRHKIGCDWRLVARINNIKKPESIRVGQRLKLPKGPFSAVVSKRDYRVDLCMGAGTDRVVLTSLPCGLGSANGTPTGLFRVRAGSKLLDPEWVHPVTGEHFDSSNPQNPIGEHWLGLEGMDATNAQLAGYGMHGTIDVDSIGQDRSLGCVRLLAEDIAVAWEALGDTASVEIRAQ